MLLEKMKGVMAVDSTMIRELWKPKNADRQASVALWDSVAADYGARVLPTAADSAALALVEREGMLPDGGTLLDVGCGAGKYALAMAGRCRQVTGVDLSPAMIAAARDMAVGFGADNAEFHVSDWDDVDLDRRGWKGAFDLVFAHMTPAVNSPDTLMKLSAASRGWCLLCKPTRRTDSVTDRLKERLGIVSDNKSYDHTMTYSFGLLWNEGALPRMEYDEQLWQMEKPLPQAKQYYTRFLAARHPLGEGAGDVIGGYLESVSRDGKVHEQIRTTVAMIYWKVP